MPTALNKKQDVTASVPKKDEGFFFQPKLTMNPPNDIYEQEADAMADKVMRMPDLSVQEHFFFKPAITPVQRKCAHYEEEEKQLQQKEINNEMITLPLPGEGKMHAVPPSHSIQPKLTINQPNDIYEQEADDMAEKVIRMPDPAINDNTFFKPFVTPVQRKCAHCQEEEEKQLQRKEDEPAVPDITPETENHISSLNEKGRYLSAAERDFFEPRMGYDFSNVQLHTGPEANESAKNINALAFTSANHIVFGASQYQPDTVDGKKLMAHELTHVVQQSQGVQKKSIQLKPSSVQNTATTSVVVHGGDASETVNQKEVLNENDVIGTGTYNKSAAASSDDSNNKSNGTSVNKLHAAGKNFIQQQHTASTVNDHIQKKDAATCNANVQHITPVSANVIQRTGEDPINTELAPDLYLIEWPDNGQALLFYRGRNWVMFQYTGGLGRRITVNFTPIETPQGRVLEVRATAGFQVTAYLGTQTEQYITNINGSEQPVSLRYQFGFSGTLRVYNSTGSYTTERVPQQREVRLSAQPLTEGDILPISELNPRGYILPTMPPVQNTQHVWSFSSQEAYNQFAASHANTRWACIVTDTGEYIAYALTTETIRRMAERIRRGQYQFDFTRDFNSRLVSSIYIYGTPLPNLEQLSNLYFSTLEDAVMGFGATRGLGEDTQECLVHHMEGGTYGRRQLSHEEAVALWDRLDSMLYTSIEHFEPEPGHTFAALQVRGRRQLHLIDSEHLRAKDNFFSFVQQAEEQGQEISFDHNTPEYRYMLTETDREHPHPLFPAILSRHEGVAEDLQGDLYHQVEETAQSAAISAISDAVQSIERLATSESAMRNFILNFHDLNEEQKTQALAMIGYVRHPRGTLPFMVAAMENQQYDEMRSEISTLRGAMEVAMGISMVSMEEMQAKANDSARGLREQLLNRLQSREIIALKIEGDLGIEARRAAYSRWGFTRLRPETYPHTDLNDQWFPGPMAGDTGSFGSVAEQLYANKVAHMSREETVTAIAGMAAAIVVTAILILVANAAGAAVAGLLFAEGSAAFIVTETVVAGASLTVMNEGYEQLMGRGSFRADDLSGSVGRLGINAVTNILMFGAFRGLNAAFSALGRTAVGGAEAIQGSAARAAIANSVRMGGVFSGAYLAGIIHARLAAGRPLTGREYAQIFLESALTMALLEVGGNMSRPFMQDIGIWARGRRLGPEMSERISTLENNIRTLQTDIINQTTNGEISSVATRDLVTRQRALLQQQRTIAEELRQSLRTRFSGDADAINSETITEINRIEDYLRFLDEAEFIHNNQIRSIDENGNQLYYRPGNAAQIAEYYRGRGETVEGPDAQGLIRVRQSSRTIEFRPEPAEGAAGGTRESDAYPRDANPNFRSISDIFRMLSNARDQIFPEFAQRLYGSQLTYDAASRNPYYDFNVPVDGVSANVVVRVTIQARGFDTRGNSATTPSTAPRPHGADTGPASYDLRWLPASGTTPGRWSAVIEVDPTLTAQANADPNATRTRSRDLEINVGHELDEIAGIVRQNHHLTGEMGTPADLTQLQQNIAREARGVVFVRGSAAGAEALTEHEIAMARQLTRHFEELSSTDAATLIPGPQTRFRAFLETMGLTTRNTEAQLNVFKAALREALTRANYGNREELIGRVESEWRAIQFETVEAPRIPAAERLPGNHLIMDAELIDHVSRPHQNSDSNFHDRGIGGGHYRPQIETYANNPSTPDIIVLERQTPLAALGEVYRFAQYRFTPGSSGLTKATAPQPAPDGTFDATYWERCIWPKSAVDNLPAFIAHGERAFASFYRTNIAGRVTTTQDHTQFDIVFEGVTYRGFYSYDGINVTSLQVHSIFVNANSF